MDKDVLETIHEHMHEELEALEGSNEDFASQDEYVDDTIQHNSEQQQISSKALSKQYHIAASQSNKIHLDTWLHHTRISQDLAYKVRLSVTDSSLCLIMHWTGFSL